MIRPFLMLIILHFSLKTFCQNTISTLGILANNTIWAVDTVFLLGDVVIKDSITLSIAPNTKIFARGYYKIDVKGRLLAIGTPNRFISFTIQDTTGFSDTSSVRGGWNGIHFENINSNNDSSILKYCKISYGKAVGQTQKEQSGGAIRIDSCSKILIESCEIAHNMAIWSGAGIHVDKNANPKILKNLIKHNISFLQGGGIASMENSGTFIHENIIIHNSAIHKDSFFITGIGGGIAVSSETTSPIISCNLVANNHTYGGAIYESTKYIKIINNIVVNNWRYGIFNGHQRGEGIYANNTICNNLEAGVLSFSQSVTLYNNIIRGNVPIFRPQGPENVDERLNGWPRTYHNNIGNPVNLNGRGNIDSATLFVRPTQSAGPTELGYNADWRLRPNSPEIDKGFVNNIAAFIGDKDVFGNPRIVGSAIDMGAAEYSPISTISITQEHPNIKVYPNPFTNQLWIEVAHSSATLRYHIFAINGQLIDSQAISNGMNLIQMADFSNGTYLMHIRETTGKQLFSTKLVKM
jgi:Right handed beta helix region/Secretion system C-terminal sorting domain